MQSHRIGRDPVRRFDNDWQVLVFDLDQLGRILRLMFRLGDDQHHRLPDETHSAMRQRGTERNGTRSELPPTPLKNDMDGAPFQPVAMTSSPVKISMTPGCLHAASMPIRMMLAWARSARRKHAAA